MTDIIKAFSEQTVANTTANTFSSGRLLRVTNLGTAPVLLTITDTNAVNTSVALLGNNVVTIEKNPADLLTANTTSTNVVVTVIAYKN